MAMGLVQLRLPLPCPTQVAAGQRGHCSNGYKPSLQEFSVIEPFEHGHGGGFVFED